MLTTKYENKNKITNIDFGSTTPTQMQAQEPEPRTFKEKRRLVTEKPNMLDQEKAMDQEERFNEANAEMMANLVGAVGGTSNTAFKFSTKGVSERQEQAENAFMKLGGMQDPKPEGKFLDKNHICLKPTKIENMYPIQNEVNMLVRR